MKSLNYFLLLIMIHIPCVSIAIPCQESINIVLYDSNPMAKMFCDLEKYADTKWLDQLVLGIDMARLGYEKLCYEVSYGNLAEKPGEKRYFITITLKGPPGLEYPFCADVMRCSKTGNYGYCKIPEVVKAVAKQFAVRLKEMDGKIRNRLLDGVEQIMVTDGFDTGYVVDKSTYKVEISN